jgi:hypothetical protein
LEDNSKEFFKCFLQNGYVIIENDNLKWLGLYQNFMKKFMEFHDKGSTKKLSGLTQWTYSNISSLLTSGFGKTTIYSKRNLNAFINNFSTEDNLIEETTLMQEHLEGLGIHVLEILRENLGQEKSFFDEILNHGKENLFKLEKNYSTPNYRIVKPQSDSGILTIHTKSSIPTLMVLNSSSLEWKKIEEEMDESDLIVFPGYTLSYLTNGLIKPLLYQSEMDFNKQISFSSSFEFHGRKDFKIPESGRTIHSIVDQIESAKHNEKIQVEWFEMIQDAYQSLFPPEVEKKNDV